MGTRIKQSAYYLPQQVVTNNDLAVKFGNWSAAQIEEKTGIAKRHVCAHDEIASDCAIAAANKLFDQHPSEKEHVDFLIFVTQSPDYASPTTACIIQDRLGFSKSIGAIDINLGCTGFVYGLSVAKGLIATGAAKHVLLLTSETLTKYIHEFDYSSRTIFGDAGAAIIISNSDSENVGQFAFGTDGSGKDIMIKPNGSFRYPLTHLCGLDYTDKYGNQTNPNNFHMDGPEVFMFSLKNVPGLVNRTLANNGLTIDDIDLFIFHQANGFMLEKLRKKCEIPPEKFFMYLKEVGNTVSSTIPIALNEAEKQGVLEPKMKVLLAAFGVGLSMAGTVIEW